MTTVSVDLGTNQLPRRSGSWMSSFACVWADGRNPTVTPVKIPGASIEDYMEIEQRLPYSAEEHFFAPSPSQINNGLKAALCGHTIIDFNVEYDAQFLPLLNERDQHGDKVFNVQDVMLRAAPYVKDWNPFFAAYEYPSLKLVADTFGLTFERPGWHSSWADAKMLLDIWAYMEANPPFYRANKMLLPDAKLLLPDPATTRFSTTVDDLPF